MIDADPSQMVREALGDLCLWEGVTLLESLEESAGHDLILIDGPSLADEAARDWLAAAHGVIVTCEAELLALRTLSVAAQALGECVHSRRGELEFHGVLLTRYRGDAWQRRLGKELRAMDGDVFFGTEIPEDAGLRGWPNHPGEAMPGGPATKAYSRLAEELATRLGLHAAMPG